MFHIILYQPEIPPNTGNIIRLCANSGCSLHLIPPLGFTLEDAQMKRAGLDHSERILPMTHDSLEHCLDYLKHPPCYGFSTKATTTFTSVSFKHGDAFLFGSETKGLPDLLLKQFSQTLVKIPVLKPSRSLNLSNAVAIAVYEGLRQLNYPMNG
ncbi:MAG: tRNA (cytidine(34)-2'-O)-methyltransferase [Methylacidiphilales bacterium]|nr:tRNA (cytidine(34)-2'-O)-methyltransferase [Candidatus Methylacidiphilales bacterium]